MKTHEFKGILTAEGWKENVQIKTDELGVIQSIENLAHKQEIDQYALPGFQNAHSHAFQYAMAGLAELHSTSTAQNDFWSWRNAMYDLALSINPEQLEKIAALLYKEMLRNGYTQVVEFHYLHHDLKGRNYNNLSETGERLIAAAKKTGIKITLIPIFYQMGGFNKPPEEKQRRFISYNIESYLSLYDSSSKSCKLYSNANVGLGIHSMRGVKTQDIIKTSEFRNQSIPFHIHISEQMKEIEDCVSFLGKRPVEWLADHVDLNENYHLVHATHINKKEIKQLAASKANVVICPTTEGNLGDGIFPLKDFLKLNGNWSIGTDSHVSLNPFEEIRLLDYGQRLTSHQRNTFGNSISGDNATIAINTAFKNGKKSTGEHQLCGFEVGKPLDALVISNKHPLIQQTSIKNLANTILYSADSSFYKGTIVNGKWVIKNGEHKNESIDREFSATIKELANR